MVLVDGRDQVGKLRYGGKDHPRQKAWSMIDCSVKLCKAAKKLCSRIHGGFSSFTDTKKCLLSPQTLVIQLSLTVVKDRFKRELGNKAWSEKMDRCLLMLLPVVKERSGI
ncbi:hypothetical protein NC651_023881 [Populus alba x Populus x berolinensis]|nr:hypothetical protein NC651_023881 [Populus alba x Populus x berolinensis]